LNVIVSSSLTPLPRTVALSFATMVEAPDEEALAATAT